MFRAVCTLDAALLYVVNLCAMGNYFIFPSVAVDFMHERWPSTASGGATGDDVGFLLASFFAIPMVLAPIVGALIGGEEGNDDESNKNENSNDHQSRGSTGGSAAVYTITATTTDDDDDDDVDDADTSTNNKNGSGSSASSSFSSASSDRRTLHVWLAAGCGANTAGFLLLVALPPAVLPPSAGVAAVAVATTVVSASLTPALALAVAPEFHGTAFGLWSSTQNVGLSSIALAVGLLADRWSPVASVFFLAMVGAAATAVSLVSLVVLTRDDRRAQQQQQQ